MEPPVITHLLSEKSREKGRDIFIFRIGNSIMQPAILLAGSCSIDRLIDVVINHARYRYQLTANSTHWKPSISLAPYTEQTVLRLL